MRLIKIKFGSVIVALMVILTSTMLSFFTIELTYRFLSPGLVQRVDSKSARTMLFSVGDNFRNEEMFFRYHPHKEIRSVTLYSTLEPKAIDDIVVEYDYDIRTNNAGLVMSRDIEIGEKVILVVGDSFTEGQGATPWFYELEANWNGSAKLINLGIMGTGPMQWWFLAERVVEEFDLEVEGVVINIILGDLVRSVWNFSEESLDCLSIGLCRYKGDIQGVDFSLLNDDLKIRQLVLDSAHRPSVSELLMPSRGLDRFKHFVKELLKKSKILVTIRGYFKPTDLIEKNKNSIVKIANLAKNNARMVVINTKEFSSNPDIEYASYEAGILRSLSDIKSVPLSWCNPGANGFHVNDGHPNANGYLRVRDCTLQAAKKMINP